MSDSDNSISRRKFISIAAAGAAGLSLAGLAGGPATARADEKSQAEPSPAKRGKIDHIGIWTWGGRIYNWKKFLDNMHRTGMDTLAVWHDGAPARARDIQAYADNLGIETQWGFSWSWPAPICLNSVDDAELWKAKVLDVLKYEYVPFGARRIFFQTAGTEAGVSCRLNCPVCQKAATEGVGPIYAKFAGSIIRAVQETYPHLQICANLHLGGVHKSYPALRAFPSSVQMMWEDLPGPKSHSETPFSYQWQSPETRLTEHTRQMVKALCELRGKDEDVAFVVKGFPCRCIAYDPMLLDDIELKVLSDAVEPIWNESAKYCEAHLDEALEIFRIIANAPARRKSVVLLIENGLWEFKRQYAALLTAEALKNPFREPGEVIKVAKAQYAAELEEVAKKKYPAQG